MFDDLLSLHHPPCSPQRDKHVVSIIFPSEYGIRRSPHGRILDLRVSCEVADSPPCFLSRVFLLLYGDSKLGLSFLIWVFQRHRTSSTVVLSNSSVASRLFFPSSPSPFPGRIRLLIALKPQGISLPLSIIIFAVIHTSFAFHFCPLFTCPCSDR